MAGHARNPSPASGYDEGPQSSCPEPFQTAATPGQLIRLLEDKLTQGSDADITLSADDARELVRALQSSKDANRQPEIEQELVEAKQELQELKELRFSANKHDFPKLVTKAYDLIWNRPMDDKKVQIFSAVVGTLHPPLSESAVRDAIKAYSRRCQQFHSEGVHYANEETIGICADTDLLELSARLPDSWSTELGSWQEIINYVKLSRGPGGSKKEKMERDQDQDQTSRRSQFMAGESPQFLYDLVTEGRLRRSTIPFLIDYGVFAPLPEDRRPVSNSWRGRSQPPLIGSRECTVPADDDGSSIPSFTDRQELKIPGDSTGESSSYERQALSSVRKLL
ncbi:hypothetical protein ACHAQK_008747 [Fusarium lateritium]